MSPLSMEPLKLVSDHQALFYAFKKNETHVLLKRWIELLKNYRLKVDYRPGESNKRTDYIPRILPALFQLAS